jgi:outer membrane biosynthesis protein TonB
VRRFLTLTLSLTLVLGLSAAGRLAAQDEKQDAPKPAETPTTEAKPQDKDQDKDKAAETPTAEAKTQEKPGEAAEKPAEATPSTPPPPQIPPEVEEKLQAARRAVAEAVAAAQDAGLVDTTLTTPPILDILVNGYANDRATLKAKLDELKAKPDVSPEAGLSPEAFGAWFTGHAQMEGVTPEKNVRIMPPSKGLKDYYDRRDALFAPLIAEARKTRGTAEPKAGEATKPAESPDDATTKPAEAEKPAAEQPKPAEDTKPAEAPKDEQPKPAEEDKEG